MGLSDVAGVFSRFFIVGFFLPAFFALVALSQLLDRRDLPSSYESAGSSSQVLILGGAGLLTGLVLSGLYVHVLRLFEGYPLQRARKMPVLGALYRLMTGHWSARFAALDALRSQPAPSELRTAAAQELARRFPATAVEVLPTRFGNVIRSFERHPRSRYGLDGVTVWPRVAMLLTDQEQRVIGDAETDVAFFVNGTLLTILTTLILIVDAIHYGFADAALLWLYAAPVVLGLLSYAAAVGAAGRWGETVRAAFDLHRLDLYTQLGVKLPISSSDEVATARAVNRCLLYGESIDTMFRSTTPLTAEPEDYNGGA